MEKRGTWDRVREIIASEMGVEHARITPESTFEELGVDSLDSVEILMAVEEEFGINIEDCEWESVRSVADILSLLDFLTAVR